MLFIKCGLLLNHLCVQSASSVRSVHLDARPNYTRNVIWLFQAFTISCNKLHATILKPTECPIIHSDQGVLYGSAEWGKMLEGKAVQSMSRRGNCYDNAVIESFFAILKSECFYSRSYHSIAELQSEIEEYLVYYNQKRIKLDLKGLSPVQYRAQYLS